jgi:uncharacterized protein YoxC
MALAFAYGNVAYIGLTVFLVAVGLGLGWAFLRLATTFDRLSSLIRGTEREVLPVINKVGGSVDRVNAQLDKLDQVTDSAANAVEAVDQAVRTVSSAVKRPAQKAAGVAAGMSHGWSRFRTSRNWRDAVEEARAAAARREQDIEDELKGAVEAPTPTPFE